jgi:hypothetical protein
VSKALPFTQARVRRAVKAAESAGLRVRRVTVKPDGSIEVASGGDNERPAVDSPAMATAASWDDV